MGSIGFEYRSASRPSRWPRPAARITTCIGPDSFPLVDLLFVPCPRICELDDDEPIPVYHRQMYELRARRREKQVEALLAARFQGGARSRRLSRHQQRLPPSPIADAAHLGHCPRLWGLLDRQRHHLERLRQAHQARAGLDSA